MSKAIEWPKLLADLRALCVTHGNQRRISEAVGVNEATLSRVIKWGVASPDTIQRLTTWAVANLYKE